MPVASVLRNRNASATSDATPTAIISGRQRRNRSVGACQTSSTAPVISAFQPSGDRTPGAFPCSAFTISTPMTMSETLRRSMCRTIAARDSPARSLAPMRQRNRHAGDEQERGKHDVGQRHAIDVRPDVEQEGRRARHAGHLVDEEHQKHVEPANEIHGQEARRARDGAHVRRRAFFCAISASSCARNVCACGIAVSVRLRMSSTRRSP